MAETVTMPKLGFDMAEGTLVRWVVLEGQEVKKGAVLAEIETDKATVEVESPYDGVLARHLVPEGEVVPVNTAIAIVAAPGEVIEAPVGVQAEAPTKEKTAAPEQKIEGAGILPTAPAPVTVTGEPKGAEAASIPGGVRASPLARRIARDLRIDLKAVRGSGPGGRVTRMDVESYIAAPAQARGEALQAAPEAVAPSPAAAKPAQKAAPLPPLAPLPDAAPIADEEISVNRLRTAIGRRMVESKQAVPHFYVTHEYDLGPIMELRKQANGFVSEAEKLSVNDFLVKAVALSLRQFPNLNASLQTGEKGTTIVRHGAINIGVAVAVEGGLLTIVCRDADRKPLRQIAQEVRTLAGRARDGRVRPEDIEGSTFSISNLGMFDVESFIAIINPPEAAILAIGSAREVPVIKDGQVVPGWRMKASISVDHRVSDGAEAARFMQALAAYIEEPVRLLL